MPRLRRAHRAGFWPQPLARIANGINRWRRPTAVYGAVSAQSSNTCQASIFAGGRATQQPERAPASRAIMVAGGQRCGVWCFGSERAEREVETGGLNPAKLPLLAHCQPDAGPPDRPKLPREGYLLHADTTRAFACWHRTALHHPNSRLDWRKRWRRHSARHAEIRAHLCP